MLDWGSNMTSIMQRLCQASMPLCVMLEGAELSELRKAFLRDLSGNSLKGKSMFIYGGFFNVVL